MASNNKFLAFHLSESLDSLINDLKIQLESEAAKSTITKGVMNRPASRYFINDYLKELASSFNNAHLHLLGFDGTHISSYPSPKVCRETQLFAISVIKKEYSAMKLIRKNGSEYTISIVSPISYNRKIEGALVLCTSFNKLFDKNSEFMSKERRQILALDKNFNTILRIGKKHDNVMTNKAACKNLPIYIQIETPKYILESPIKSMQLNMIAISILVMLSLLAVLFFNLHKVIIKPILRLSDGVGKLDNWKNLKKSPNDLNEICDLIQAFNNMQSNLQNRTAMLLHAEKMASVGQLAAGIAHEINNPAGFVNGNLDTMKRYTDSLLELIDSLELALKNSSGPKSKEQKDTGNINELKDKINYLFIRKDIVELIDESLEGMQRIERIVSDLKDFSHVDQHNDILECDINELIDKTINVAWNELKYKCEICKNYNDLPLIQANSGEISQVILNLLINAAQSTESGCIITISTRPIENGIIISIEDNGPGISAEIRNKIFDPFFTTKPVGKGTGLGLHICQKIIEAHNGTIKLEMDRISGTEFQIFLPLKHIEGER
ncbi:MAG: ATP-binding protein [Planctomycetota bacterium]